MGEHVPEFSKAQLLLNFANRISILLFLLVYLRGSKYTPFNVNVKLKQLA